MFRLAMLTLLANFLILIIYFLRKLKCRSAVTKAFWCHVVVFEMKLIQLCFILELVVDFTE